MSSLICDSQKRICAPAMKNLRTVVIFVVEGERNLQGCIFSLTLNLPMCMWLFSTTRNSTVTVLKLFCTKKKKKKKTLSYCSCFHLFSWRAQSLQESNRTQRGFSRLQLLPVTSGGTLCLFMQFVSAEFNSLMKAWIYSDVYQLCGPDTALIIVYSSQDL